MREGFVLILVSEEPLAPVVALETSKEAEEIGSEIRGHEFKVRAAAEKSKAGGGLSRTFKLSAYGARRSLC